MKKDLLSINDFSRKEILALFEKSTDLKAKRKTGEEHLPLRGKSLGFFKGVKSEKAYKFFPLEVGRCRSSQPRDSGIHRARPPPRPGARKERRLIEFFRW